MYDTELLKSFTHSYLKANAYSGKYIAHPNSLWEYLNLVSLCLDSQNDKRGQKQLNISVFTACCLQAGSIKKKNDSL